MRGRMGVLLLVGAIAAACAGTSPATPAPPVVAPTPAPATSTSTANATPDAPTPPPSPTVEPWDLVWISDSSGSGGVPEAYAARIRADLGVPVRVHDAWTGGLTASTVLYILRGNMNGVLPSWGSGMVNLPDLVRAAEVIVVSGNPADSRDTSKPDTWNCAIDFEPEPDCKPTTDCGPDYFAPYVADLEAIFDEIFTIRGGRPVILRTHDWYLPWGPARTWDTCNQTAVCVGCWHEYSDAIHRAAASRGVPVAGYYEAFSGPEGVEPLPSDWIVDDVHPSKTGADAFADVVADLGYDEVSPTPGG